MPPDDRWRTIASAAYRGAQVVLLAYDVRQLRTLQAFFRFSSFSFVLLLRWVLCLAMLCRNVVDFRAINVSFQQACPSADDAAALLLRVGVCFLRDCRLCITRSPLKLAALVRRFRFAEASNG